MKTIAPHPTYATWQQHFEAELPYFTQAYRRRLNWSRPEKREEEVQEALVQTAKFFATQYRMHGKLTQYPYKLARTVASRVRRGASSTRPPNRRADLMDRTARTTGPKREADTLSIFAALRMPVGLSIDFILDLLAWIEALPDKLRRYAALVCEGTPDATIRRIMGVGQQRVCHYRQQLRARWVAEMA